VVTSWSGSRTAVTARPSMAWPHPRCCHIISRWVCGAAANAASASPVWIVNAPAILSAASAWARFAPASIALRASPIEGRTCQRGLSERRVRRLPRRSISALVPSRQSRAGGHVESLAQPATSARAARDLRTLSFALRNAGGVNHCTPLNEVGRVDGCRCPAPQIHLS
jgi:hypothetical protein